MEPAFADAAKAKHLNVPRLRQLLGFGGVRIEDDVIVTATGIENMTRVPRTVAEIEATMAPANKLDNLSIALAHRH